MKYFKSLGIFSAIVALTICFGLTQAALAETASNNQPELAEDETKMDIASADTSAQISLHIADITLDKKSYNAGETINGSFKLENHSAFAVTKLSFQVLIGAEYKEIAPNIKTTETILDFSPRQGSLTIAKDGSIMVPFTYVVPAFVSGEKLATRISVLSEAGNLITWSDSAYLSIKKGTAGVLIKSASVVLSNSESFRLGEGPTIYKDKDPKEAFVALSISNLSSAEVTVVPHTIVYRQNGMKEVQKNTSAAFNLKSKETKEVSILLPTLSYEPGVYLADIILKDTEGKQLESMIEARYIIGGNIATVQNISASKEILAKGEKFIFNALITGTAPDMSDIRNGIMPTSDSNKAGTVEIELYNEKDERVAAIKDQFTLIGSTVFKEELEAASPSEALRAEVLVYDDSGELILYYEKNLSADYDTVAFEATKTFTGQYADQLFTALVAALVLVVVFTAIYVIRKRKVSGGMMVLLFMFVCAATILSSVPARAAGYASLLISIAPASPYDWQPYAPGQEFYATGSTWFTACSNSTSNVRVRVESSWGETHRLGIIDTAGGFNKLPHGFYPNSTTFTAGPFHAPTTPGTHWLRYIGVNTDTFGNSIVGDAWIHIIVTAPPATNSGGTTAGGGTSTGTSTAACGSRSATVASGQNITSSTSGLCASGSNLYGNPTIGIDTSSWKWMCKNGANSSFCSATCATGTLYCPATGVCSADCVDWCVDSIPGNPAGNQPDRSLYKIGANGECTAAPLISKYDLNPSLTDSSGTCKAFWTINSVSDVKNISCAINGVSVPCTNTTGYGVKPGTAKLEVTATGDKSSITDTKELKCTMNPSVIER